jgi:Peptidase family S41
MAEVELGKRRELLDIARSPNRHRTEQDLGTFLEGAERRARLSRKERLRIVEQALVVMEMTYVHLPMKRAIHAINPIQQLKLLRFHLAEWNVVLESTIRFHRRMLSIFGSARDLHTLYLLPQPFRDGTAYLPFLIEQYFDRGKQRFIVTRTAVRDEDALSISEEGREARFESGVEVLAWNGVKIARAIEINGESQAGSNPDARFARGLDNLTIRPLNSTLPPDEMWVDVLFRATNGVIASHRSAWLVHKTSDTGESSTSANKKRTALDVKRTRILEVKKDLYRRASPTLGSIKDVLYALKKTVHGQTLGYIRIFSFDVVDAWRFRRAFANLITKEGFPQDGLVLDVRGNPGGSIRAAESLLQLLTPNTIEPESFEFLNTPLNFQICESAPDDWDLKRWVPSIRDSVLTGATYSSGFPLTLGPLCNGIGQVYYGPVVLITDALSYSATDIFAAGFQDNDIGPVLGTGGNTGAGGANIWSLDDLLRAQKTDPASPFKKLPKGAEIIVAMRRSIRVGPRAGSPLEEFGVAPDVLHRMTERDLLSDNVDLLSRAARLIQQRPSYRLSVNQAKREGTSRMVVSAASKVPTTKPGRGISRVDLYVNGRPMLSIDAKDGHVPPTAVDIGNTGPARKAVKAQAWDRSGRLVAVCRTSAR